MNWPFQFSTRALRWLAIILPVSYWGGVLLLRTVLFSETRSPAGDLFALVAIGLGATVFSFWVFRIVDEREAEIRRRSDQLKALHNAAIALTTELELGEVLQKVVDLSRTLVGARYGALGVLDAEGKAIEQFLTSGISPQQRALIGAPPRGHGLLGVMMREGKPLRVPDIERDPRSAGFPPHHPTMHSLLGVPIKFKGRVIGVLYLTDKQSATGTGDEPFSAQDQEVLEMFATQAAIAIENAQLYRQKQILAVLQERERFGMDLHDGIIQSIYAIGLMLDDAAHRMNAEPQEAKQRVEQAIHDLNAVIRDIRNYILDLRPQRFQGRDLGRGLQELARDLRANTFLTVNLTADPIEPNLLTPEQTVEILHIVQEALTNVRKHARATAVELELVRDADAIEVSVQDNGIGLGDGGREGGQGLNNMRERARSLGGELRVSPGENGGTRVLLRVPVNDKARNAVEG